MELTDRVYVFSRGRIACRPRDCRNQRGRDHQLHNRRARIGGSLPTTEARDVASTQQAFAGERTSVSFIATVTGPSAMRRIAVVHWLWRERLERVMGVNSTAVERASANGVDFCRSSRSLERATSARRLTFGGTSGTSSVEPVGDVHRFVNYCSKIKAART